MPPRYSREIEQPIVMGDSLKDQFRTSPCEASCPAGNPIQKMQSLVEKGRFGEALRYLRARTLSSMNVSYGLVCCLRTESSS